MPLNQHFEKQYDFGSLIVLNVFFLVTQNQKAFSGMYQICLLFCCVKKPTTALCTKKIPQNGQISQFSVKSKHLLSSNLFEILHAISWTYLGQVGTKIWEQEHKA